MVVKMEQGWDRARAATFAWTSTAFPMLTGTLVTAAGFLPVGFAKSSAGEYAGGIFWVVGLALIASWLVAVVFTPYLGLKLLPDFAKHGAHENPDAIYDTRIYRALRRVIEFCLRWRKIGRGRDRADVRRLARRLRLRAAAVLPDLDPHRAVPRDAPAGRHRDRRRPTRPRRRPSALLAGDTDIATYTTYVGQGAPRFWLGLNPVLPNPNFAQIVIVTKDLEARERVKARLEKAIADGALPEARTRVDRFVFGPPVGFPVQFRVVGPDPMKVRAIAEDVRKVMAAEPQGHRSASRLERAGQVDPARGRSGSRPRARPHPAGRRADAADAGQRTDRDAVSRGHREHRRGGARGTDAERLELGRLPTLTIATRNGVPVPLSQIARLNYEYEEPILWRRNRDIVLTVRGDIVDGVQAPDVSNEIAPKLQSIKDALPYGYRIETGGSIEESAKANVALAAVFPVMAVVMLALLMIQLQSFSRLALVFVTAPLGLIGATGALLDRRQAVRLRRAARPDRARRHDHAQHRDPGRPDRPRHRGRARALSGDHRRHRAARPPGGAHRARRDPRHDPARAQHLLGPDGDHHHGRAAGRDRAHAAGRAGALRALVPGAARRGCGNGEGCGARGCGATLTADRGGIILLPLVPATRLRTRLRRAESSVRRSFSEGEKRGPSSSSSSLPWIPACAGMSGSTASFSKH